MDESLRGKGEKKAPGLLKSNANHFYKHEKVSYAVAVLSEKYSVSERKVYALVKRFQSDCKPLTV